MIIYVDECGYTGPDLLDSAQPVFVLATHNLTEEQACAIKARHFSYTKALELKHSELRRKKRHQEAVTACLEELVARAPVAIRAALVHKRFALTAKVVDFVMEPVARASGWEMDRDGSVFGTANMLYFVLQAEGSTTLTKLLTLFQKLARARDRETLEAFQSFLRHEHEYPVMNEALEGVQAATSMLGPRLLKLLPDGALDLSLTAALRCVQAWRADQQEHSLQIIHDESENMKRQARVWDWIVSPSAPAASVGYGTNLAHFPMSVEQTTYQSSKGSAALQLADLIAGALGKWATWLNSGCAASDWYGCRLHSIFERAPATLFAWICWPDAEIARVDTPPEQQTSLEYLTKRLADLEAMRSSNPDGGPHTSGRR